MELLAFASRQFAPKIVDMSVRFFRILFLFFVNERSGRLPPPAERSTLYVFIDFLNSLAADTRYDDTLNFK